MEPSLRMVIEHVGHVGVEEMYEVSARQREFQRLQADQTGIEFAHGPIGGSREDQFGQNRQRGAERTAIKVCLGGGQGTLRCRSLRQSNLDIPKFGIAGIGHDNRFDRNQIEGHDFDGHRSHGAGRIDRLNRVGGALHDGVGVSILVHIDLQAAQYNDTEEWI